MGNQEQTLERVRATRCFRRREKACGVVYLKHLIKEGVILAAQNSLWDQLASTLPTGAGRECAVKAVMLVVATELCR